MLRIDRRHPDASITRSAAFEKFHAPFRFVSITASQSASSSAESVCRAQCPHVDEEINSPECVFCPAYHFGRASVLRHRLATPGSARLISQFHFSNCQQLSTLFA